MSMSPQQAKTVSSIAAIASAFLVFVLGGGAILGMWASERADAQAEVVAAEAAARDAARLAAQERRAAMEQAERAAEEDVRRRRSSRKSRSARARPRSPATPTASVAQSESSAAQAPAVQKPRGKLTGKATVLVRGDATRVRLMGAKGTYSAGPLPAGAYTVQATFPGAEPRMAGAVEIYGGQVAKLVCSSATKTCSVR